jgi:hypothetical protein
VKRLVRLNVAMAASAVLVAGAGLALVSGGPAQTPAPAVEPQPTSGRDGATLVALRAELAASALRANGLRDAIIRARAEMRYGAEASRGPAPAYIVPTATAAPSSTVQSHASVRSPSSPPTHTEPTRSTRPPVPTASPSRSDDDGPGGGGGGDH